MNMERTFAGKYLAFYSMLLVSVSSIEESNQPKEFFSLIRSGGEIDLVIMLDRQV